MGVVHLARQLDLGRVVAVKRLIRGASASPDDMARFHEEAASAARLSHPHIVAVYDVGVEDGLPYLVMQYVEGTTLARQLADGPLPPRVAAALLEPICRAIEHAHDRGVLHRDLKPSNILIDDAGRPLVGDFGLAKRIDLGDGLGPTITGAILGSPSYMAPEQASSRRATVGPPADVYALGAILYQMLTGRPPFQAASPLDTMLLVLEQDPIPPRVLNPKADPDLEMVALKCLQKRPENRYPTAEALALDLDNYLAGQPVSARSTRFQALAGRYLGETPHAALLENWGELWMYHSVALLVFYGITWYLMARGVTARRPYFLIFSVGLGGVGGLLLATPATPGAGHVRRATTRARLGGRCPRRQLAPDRRSADRVAGDDLGPHPDDHQRDALRGQGGDLVGRVLHPGSLAFSDLDPRHALPEHRHPVVRPDVGGVLLRDGSEVSPPPPPGPTRGPGGVLIGVGVQGVSTAASVSAATPSASRVAS